MNRDCYGSNYNCKKIASILQEEKQEDDDDEAVKK